jgi:N-acetylglucosamine-6-phosphate deacetylase
MTTLHIDNVLLVLPGEVIRPGSLLVEGGVITAVWVSEPGSRPVPDSDHLSDIVRINGRGRLLSPGLIDMHVHGIGLAMFDAGVEALRTAGAMLPAFGTTCVLPTLVPREMGPKLLAHLEETADALPTVPGARMPGLHLEGPFMALAGAGCATLPGDVGLLEELLSACRGRMAVMSISPDTPGILPVVERLRERGVVPFITHTRADAEQTAAAIDAGAVHATHFYDVFHLPAETEPGARPVGAVEAILADPRASVDFIADGVHVHPMAIRAALAAKGFQHVMLITDANIGAGLPAGTYDTPWGYPVRVAPGQGARIGGDHPMAGALAGSALTMDAGLRNLLQWLDLPPAQVWAMATANPARLLGLTRQGTLKAGALADLVLWDDDLTPAMTWVHGEVVYEKP